MMDKSLASESSLIESLHSFIRKLNDEENALVVVEEAADAAFIAPESFEEIERRSYGDSELVFLRSG